MVSTYKVNPDAMEAYLRGMQHWWRWSDEGASNAVRYFQQATEIEPNFAPAHAGLALTYITGGTFLQIWPPREGVPKGKAAAQRAIELDPLLADAYVAMGIARENFDWDWAGAEKDFKRALELSPHSTLALDGYVNIFALRGQFDEAITLLNKALELDPYSPALHHDVGWTYWASAKFDLAMPLFRKALNPLPVTVVWALITPRT